MVQLYSVSQITNAYLTHCEARTAQTRSLTKCLGGFTHTKKDFKPICAKFLSVKINVLYFKNICPLRPDIK